MEEALLENILNISRRMAETRTLSPLLDYVLEQAIKLVGAERGFVVLVQPDGSLAIPIKRKQDGTDIEDAEDQISKSVLNEVLETGQPLLLRDAMADPHFNLANSVMHLKLRSIICVPLISQGETIGAIYVENRSIRGRFSDQDLPPLILFANQAAVAVENATLNEDLERRVAARTREVEQAMTQVETSWLEAVEANRLRMVWLNNFTHDLRTSLSVASGALILIQTGKFGSLSSQQLEWLTKSIEAINYSVDLINDLLDLSKLEMEGLILEPETVTLFDFLRSVYEVGQGLPWAENVSFELNVPDQLPELKLDPVRIRQVLLNLLANAQKFTHQGKVILYARSQADRNEVLLGVADSGEGIPVEKQERLFERFHQVDDNLERRKAGSGLGLAICRELVEMHGGRLWVESSPEVGSNFMFTLPLTAPVSSLENKANHSA